MSALHQAVARAIADHDGLRGQLTWDEVGADWQAMYGRMAEAAVGVCLAEAQRAVEALPTETLLLGAHRKAGKLQGHYCVGVERDAVLAVLAALAEEQA